MRTAITTCRYGKIEYPPNDVFLGRALEIYGEWSEGELALFRQLLRPGAVAIDVGANIGALTLGMAQMVGSGGTIHAFEPQPEIYEILCRNIALNGLAQVVPHREALGATGGAVNIPQLNYDEPQNFGGVVLGGSGGNQGKVVTIDSFNWPQLRLIKADVEGMELDVLRGARETIRRLSPVLYVENDRRDKSEALIAFILDLDYRAWWHITPLFNSSNFRGKTENIFGGLVSCNMVALSRAATTQVTGMPEILSPKESVFSEDGRFVGPPRPAH